MEFEVGSFTYRNAKLGPKQQFHLARRLAPILTALQGADEGSLFGAMATSIAEMPDEQCNYILDTCLSVVQRQQGDKWAKVLNDRNKELMFEDIDFKDMLAIAKNVIEDNLGNFFGGKAGSDGSNPSQTA